MSKQTENPYLASASEKQIQSAICQYLALKSIPFAVTDAAIVPTEKGARQRVTTGWFDVTACFGGRFVGIEVKTATGKLRDSQRELHGRVERAGGLVIVARCVDDVMRILK